MEEFLPDDDLEVLPDPDGQRIRNTIQGILSENNIIESDSGGTPSISDQDMLSQIREMALFSFYFEGWETDGGILDELNYMILDDELIATIWTNRSNLRPIHSSKIIRRPLEHMDHAFGHCPACPTKSFIGYNLGNSNIHRTTLEQMEDVEIPDTSAYSKSALFCDSFGIDHNTCQVCQEYMSDWLADKIRKNPDYLWALGGSGIPFAIPAEHGITYGPDDREEYTLFDLLAGGEPPAEVEETDSVLEQSDADTMRVGLSSKAEAVFNVTLGIELFVEYGFDRFEANCKIREPVKFGQETDIVLFDSADQKLLIIETSAENRIRGSRIRDQESLALQLHALSERYEALDVCLIYLTTGKYPDDLDTDSATKEAHEWISGSEISSEIVSCPDSVSVGELSHTGINHIGSAKFTDVFTTLHSSLVEDCHEVVSKFHPPS